MGDVFCLGFLVISYIASLYYKNTTHILFSIGFIICWYLSDIIKELKKK